MAGSGKSKNGTKTYPRTHRLTHSVGTHPILVDLPWTPQQKTCTLQFYGGYAQGTPYAKESLSQNGRKWNIKKIHQHIPTHTQTYTQCRRTRNSRGPAVKSTKNMYTATVRWLRTGNPCQKVPESKWTEMENQKIAPTHTHAHTELHTQLRHTRNSRGPAVDPTTKNHAHRNSTLATHREPNMPKTA